MSADLVLVPGLNNTRAVFDGVVAHLPAGITALAVDNPPLDSVEAVAAALLPNLPDRFWLAGFSFGGYVAMALLAAAPERVQGLALVCSTPNADAPAAKTKRLAALAAVAEGRYLAMADAQAANAFHPDSLLNTALLAQRHQMVRDYGAERYAAHVRAAMNRPDRSHLLDGLRPTLAVAAAHDQVVPPATMAAFVERCPACQWVQIPGAGHLLPMEQPLALAGTLARWALS